MNSLIVCVSKIEYGVFGFLFSKHSQILRACVFIFEYKVYGFYEQELGLFNFVRDCDQNINLSYFWSVFSWRDLPSEFFRLCVTTFESEWLEVYVLGLRTINA